MLQPHPLEQRLSEQEETLAVMQLWSLRFPDEEIELRRVMGLTAGLWQHWEGGQEPRFSSAQTRLQPTLPSHSRINISPISALLVNFP